MIKILILYAPQDSGMKKFVDALQKAFPGKEFMVSVKSSSKAQIPDIAAADAAIFGSKGNSAISIHTDYKELLRAFGGVNLSGRSVGFFIEKDTSTFEDFSNALKESDIAIFEEPLIYQERGLDFKQLKRWISQFILFVRRNMHA
jgi:flavodoxin